MTASPICPGVAVTVIRCVEHRSHTCPGVIPVTTIVGGGRRSAIDAEAVPTFPAVSETLRDHGPEPVAAAERDCALAGVRLDAVHVAPPSVEKPTCTGRCVGEDETHRDLPVVVVAAPPSMMIEPVGAVCVDHRHRKVFIVVLPAASRAVTVTSSCRARTSCPGFCEYVIVGVEPHRSPWLRT